MGKPGPRYPLLAFLREDVSKGWCSNLISIRKRGSYFQFLTARDGVGAMVFAEFSTPKNRFSTSGKTGSGKTP
jgi:hypothetical protein